MKNKEPAKMIDYIAKLQDAIKRLHGRTSTHIQTIPLTEQFQGKILWQGEVEMFALHGHPQARHCYAWTYRDGDNTEHYTAVLELPPVDSPRNAVRAAIAAQVKGG